MSAQFTSAQIDALFSQDVNIRLHAARQLEIVRFGGLEDLDHEEYLMATADWLARNGDVTALPQLQRLLGHPDTLVRASAAGAVAKIDPALGLPILAELLEEDDRRVRSHVVERLCSIRSPEVVKILSQALLSLYSNTDRARIDPSDDWTRDLRRELTSVLGLWEDPYALASLMRAARDGDPRVRRNAIGALANIRNDKALPVLLGGLDDPDASVRYEAAYALGELADSRAADFLLRTLGDRDSKVVLGAIDALVVLKDPRTAGELLRIISGGSDREARAAALALPALGHEVSVPLLIAQLHSSSADTATKMMAASLLGVTGDAAAAFGLITALGNRAVPVRIAAARALGRLGASGAVGYLVEVLEGDPDPEVREVTAEALGELGSASAAWALEKAQASEHVALAQKAERALLRVGRAQITTERSPENFQWHRARAPRLLMKNRTFDVRI